MSCTPDIAPSSCGAFPRLPEAPSPLLHTRCSALLCKLINYMPACATGFHFSSVSSRDPRCPISWILRFPTTTLSALDRVQSHAVDVLGGRWLASRGPPLIGVRGALPSLQPTLSSVRSLWIAAVGESVLSLKSKSRMRTVSPRDFHAPPPRARSFSPPPRPAGRSPAASGPGLCRGVARAGKPRCLPAESGRRRRAEGAGAPGPACPLRSVPAHAFSSSYPRRRAISLKQALI